MSGQTTLTNLLFLPPFQLPGVAGLQPAGGYRLRIEQEELHGVSFVIHRTVRALLEVPVPGSNREEVMLVPVRLDELAQWTRADCTGLARFGSRRARSGLVTRSLPAPR